MNAVTNKLPRQNAAVLHQSQAHSPQAEQALIGSFLDDPIAVYDQVAGKLKPEHLMDPFCKLAFSRGIELVEEGSTPDLVMLAAAMDGYVSMDVAAIEEELGDIFGRYPSSKSVAGWTSIILDKAIQRKLNKTGERLSELAHAQDFGPEEKIAQANELLIEASAALASDSVATTEEMVFNTVAAIEKRMESSEDVAGISFGFPDLDDATTGMHGSELIVVAGRPGMGKTAFAMAMAKATAGHENKSKRRGVLFFTLEMSQEQMGMRWLSTLYELPQTDMRSGRISDAVYQKLKFALTDSKEYPFFVDKNATVTADKISSVARKEMRERKGGISLIIVDYLQLVTAVNRSNANRAEIVGEISRALKSLSRELKIPVVALSQLNRALEQRQDKRPMMSDLRESGSIEQDADVIIFLYRDDYYLKELSKEPGIAEIIIAKQRNGEPQTIKLGWDGPTTKFRSLRAPAVQLSTTQSVNLAFEHVETSTSPF